MGQQFGNQVVIEGGLKKGDKVIIEGITKVRPGIEVNPVPTQSIQEKAARQGAQQ